MTARGRVFLLDDDRDLVDVLVRGLRRRGFDSEGFTTADALLDGFGTRDPDTVLTDLHMPGLHGLEICRRVRERRPGIPVVVLTAFGSLESAVEAIRVGAYDFVAKPVDVDALALVLDRAVEHRRLTDELRRLRAASGSDVAEELVGESPAMRRVVELVGRVAPTEASVLVCGESGTGKELVARAVHRASGRASGPFVPINCAAMPENLLESELFGHVRGAFTDARSARAGLFVRANGGTLFLDEIGDMPLGLQGKLLRVLQERRVRPVGADEETAVDVRLVAATHRDLDALVEDGRFRQDLLFRLDVIRLDLPPLRARGTDVLALAQRFVEACAHRTGRPVVAISPPAARKLLDYDWPGNVRELMNCVERAVALAAYDQVTVDDLPPRIAAHEPQARVLATIDDPAQLVALEEVERRYILHVIDAVRGNKALAARILGLDRKTLYRKLERWERSAAE